MSCHLAVIYIHNVETDCISFILPVKIIFGKVLGNFSYQASITSILRKFCMYT